ncbi:MAG: alpha/beta hydrolase-fold protein [Gammaproteobacteria bacterium]
MTLPYLEVDPPAARASVIWLHGLGADGHDFEAIVPELGLPPSAGVRFIFPHAPERPVTINSGYVMRAWYDIVSLDFAAAQDTAGIRESAQQIEALIAAEYQRGVAYENIVLAGFSQGGVIALQVALRYPQRLAGVMALSTYLAMPDRLALEASEANRTIPIFMAHGVDDTVVPYAQGEAARRLLEQQHYPLTWQAYPMEHSVHPDEVGDIARWLRQVLALA